MLCSGKYLEPDMRLHFFCIFISFPFFPHRVCVLSPLHFHFTFFSVKTFSGSIILVAKHLRIVCSNPLTRRPQSCNYGLVFLRIWSTEFRFGKRAPAFGPLDNISRHLSTPKDQGSAEEGWAPRYLLPLCPAGGRGGLGFTVLDESTGFRKFSWIF